MTTFRHSERSEESLVDQERFLGRWRSLGMTIPLIMLRTVAAVCVNPGWQDHCHAVGELPPAR
ncbi:MAG: hypothetical protein Fur005_14990 [Roseiflexaceae bacterium]